MQIRVVRRCAESIRGHHLRPPTCSLHSVRFGVLERRVYLEIHVDKKTIPNDAGDKAHVAWPSRLALDKGRYRERLVKRHYLGRRCPVARKNLFSKTLVHQ